MYDYSSNKVILFYLKSLGFPQFSLEVTLSRIPIMEWEYFQKRRQKEQD